MNLRVESLIFSPDSGSEHARLEPGIIHAVNTDNSRLDQAWTVTWLACFAHYPCQTAKVLEKIGGLSDCSSRRMSSLRAALHGSVQKDLFL